MPSTPAIRPGVTRSPRNSTEIASAVTIPFSRSAASGAVGPSANAHIAMPQVTIDSAPAITPGFHCRAALAKLAPPDAVPHTPTHPPPPVPTTTPLHPPPLGPATPPR